jgi:hypothetical protein
LVGKPEGERPPRPPRCRWDDDIERYLKELMNAGSPTRG